MALAVCRLEAEEYEQVKLKQVQKGTLEFIHKKKTVAFPISLSMKVFDDKGTEFDPIEGMQFLARGNILDIKTDTDSKTGKESVVEVRFVSGKVLKRQTSKDVDLKPSPDFKDNPILVNLPQGEEGRYYQSARVGDFVEYRSETATAIAPRSSKWETIS